jgi:hypothetical protein
MSPITPPLRDAAQAYVRNVVGLLQLMRALSGQQLFIYNTLTDLRALDAAKGNGDLRVLERLSESEADLKTGPAALAACRPDAALAEHIGFAALVQQLRPEWEAARHAQEQCARLHQGLRAGGPRSDEEVRASRGALVAVIEADLHYWERHEAVVLGAVRRLLEGPAGPRVPPAPPIARLQIMESIVLLDGAHVPLDMGGESRAAAVCLLRHLLAAAGDWRSSTELNDMDRQGPCKGLHMDIRWDRVRKRLPACLLSLIDSHRSLGYRLSPAIWHR